MSLDVLPYWLVAGVFVGSFAAPLLVGFDDAWFVPLAVLPFGLLYILYDRRMRRVEEQTPPENRVH